MIKVGERGNEREREVERGNLKIDETKKHSSLSVCF